MTKTRKPSVLAEPANVLPIRCAIYARVSNDERLGSAFNSLDAQREAAEAYIISQRAEGWQVVGDRYDDGGYSGALSSRPALDRMLADCRAGNIDIVVVYKVDRLSRSLIDFVKMLEVFSEHDVGFVSVTQHFDTTSSMGRLTLNMLLSFAQFEREVTAERIRDKIAATRRKGKWCGGVPPLGYGLDRVRKCLTIDNEEADLVRWVFDRYLTVRSLTALARELNQAGRKTKTWITADGFRRGGGAWSANQVARVLGNVVYIGQVAYGGTCYPGEHERIVSDEAWTAAEKLRAHNLVARSQVRQSTPGMLTGKVRCSTHDATMAVTYTSKKGRRYHYYRCSAAQRRGLGDCAISTISASELETRVVAELRAVVIDPRAGLPVEMAQVARIWDLMGPGQTEDLVRRLVDVVRVERDRLDIRVSTDACARVAAELRKRGISPAREPG